MQLTTFLIDALLVQLLLYFLIIILPNIFNTLFIASYRAARFLETKYACSKVPFLVTSLVSLLDSNAYLNATLVDLIGRLYHSYSVVGLENIPLNRPALLIYYHGIMPSDMQYLPIRVYLKSGRFIRQIVDHFFFYIPLWRNIVRPYLFPGPFTRCVSTLASGELLQISPGGGREAFFATDRYLTVWKSRIGFARVAKETGVDIIPVFTRNIRQIFYIPEPILPLFRPLHEMVRLPVVPFFGGFPVQLTSFVGKPIPADSADSPQELATLTRKAIEDLIEEHQSFPASVCSAIGERFDRGRHRKETS